MPGDWIFRGVRLKISNSRLLSRALVMTSSGSRTGNKDDTRVVGVYAYATAGQVFRHQDACVVAGSEALMRGYIATFSTELSASLVVSKIRFGDIEQGLNDGAGYAFDRESYARFYSLARRAGFDDLDGFSAGSDDQFHFIKIKMDSG